MRFRKNQHIPLYQLLVAVLVLFVPFSGLTQIVLSNTATVDSLTQHVLTGDGLDAQNILLNGDGPAALTVHPGVQFFSVVSGTDFPFQSGVILRTDDSPLSTVDPDLSFLAFPLPVSMGSVIEFDFVATGDTMKFQYMFVSSEYTSFTCSQWNDAFGFFLSGPGINGPYTDNAINLATIPGTNTPVAINTVNSGFPSPGFSPSLCENANPDWQDHTIYFTAEYNPLLDGLGSMPPYNGGTIAMIAAAGLECNETYHIKMGVVSDGVLHSAVFLEAESFEVFGYEVVVQPTVQGPMTDSLMAEGCVAAQLAVIRNMDGGDSLENCIPINWAGTLDPWTDLQTWDDTICFPAGVDTIYIDFTPIQDGVVEVDEEITITLISVNACGVQTPTEVTLYVTDNYVFSYDLSPDQTVFCRTTNTLAEVTNITGSLPPFVYSWSPNGEIDPQISLIPGTNPQETIPYTVTVTDFCGQSISQTVNLIVNETIGVSGSSSPTDCGLASGSVDFPVVGVTNPVSYELTGPGINGSLNQNQASNLTSGWYYITVEDAVCSTEDSVFVSELGPSVAGISASLQEGFSPLTITFTNSSQNADSYLWDFGNGETLTTTSTDNQTMTYEEEGPLDIVVCLVAIQPGCQDTACVLVKILEFIPPPVFDVPNVFSPNGDGNNDTWNFFNLEFVESIELTILNRWGNVVFESTDPNPTWDGRLPNGSDASEGVYFYKFFLQGKDKFTTHEGHGYLQLIRE
jgi:gliding motility-associated-like protein